MVKLAREISWDKLELEFKNLYSDQGRPSIPIRKIAGLLLLKELFKESDESVVERWIENPYWQYFTGEGFFQSKQPFDPSEFVHFRKRLKEAGLEFETVARRVWLYSRSLKMNQSTYCQYFKCKYC